MRGSDFRSLFPMGRCASLFLLVLLAVGGGLSLGSLPAGAHTSSNHGYVTLLETTMVAKEENLGARIGHVRDNGALAAKTFIYKGIEYHIDGMYEDTQGEDTFKFRTTRPPSTNSDIGLTEVNKLKIEIDGKTFEGGFTADTFSTRYTQADKGLDLSDNKTEATKATVKISTKEVHHVAPTNIAATAQGTTTLRVTWNDPPRGDGLSDQA